MRVAGILFASLLITPPQIFAVTVFSQDIDRKLFHHDSLVMCRYSVGPLFDQLLYWRLVISVGLHFQSIELNLFGAECHRLTHACNPASERLTRVPKNKFNIRLVTGVL